MDLSWIQNNHNHLELFTVGFVNAKTPVSVALPVATKSFGLTLHGPLTTHIVLLFINNPVAEREANEVVMFDNIGKDV